MEVLDKDTVVFNSSIEVTSGDTLQFTDSWHDYAVGDTITVEPIKDMGEVQLLVRANSRRISAVAIEELFQNGQITLL